MALFNVNVDFARRREEREKLGRLAAAREGFRNVIERRNKLPVAPDGLAGVTGNDPLADLAAELRNEELATSASNARDSYSVDLLDALVGMEAAGLDSAKVSSLIDAENRRSAIDSLRGGLTDEQFIDAYNNKEISPYRQSGGVIHDRYTGTYEETPSAAALADQRRAAALASEAAAGSSDALAELRWVQRDRQRFKQEAIEDVLSQPTDPLLALDIVNEKSVYKPERVKVRRKDGSEALMDAIPNQAGGFDYRPAMSDGEQIVSAPGGSEGTALQRDTSYIAETLQIPPNQALLYKLQLARKSPEGAWEDLVGRLITANKHAKPDAIKQKAEDLWAVVRPGEAIPTATDAGMGGGAGDDAQRADAVARAEAEGYTNFGNWTPQGVEVLDDAGQVIGHYY